ncbi:UNVERIFIED_CONTAM: hypothetical protein GTU68_016130 [Idotea baltica]|nr:hypothetical protein [Idotea baltica]
MQRCIELAARGIGHVAPNPPVGAVIVYNNRIIGEGWHKGYGQDHAEVMALNSVSAEDKKYFSQSTLYVSLEPCNHVGKTPPCSDRIIAEGIPTVVIGTMDPNSSVKGQGLQRLQSAGIDVIESIAQTDCDWLIRRFKKHAQQRPYYILKWAQSAQGYMGLPDRQIWFSNSITKLLSHKWRSQIDGLLVGHRTITIDKPTLNNRFFGSRSPVIIILDVHNKLADNQHIKTLKSKIIIINSEHQYQDQSIHFERIDSAIELYPQLDQILVKHSLYTIMIEGGATTLKSFIQAKIWDEARIIKTAADLNHGIIAPKLSGTAVSRMRLQSDVIETWISDTVI